MLLSSAAFATSLPTYYSALLNVHFPQMYQGQPVVSVLAHIGMRAKSAQGFGGQDAWRDMHDIQLTAQGTRGFAATATLADAQDSGSPGNPIVYGPRASYQVTLASGQVIWVSDVVIPVTQVICFYPSYGPVQADQDNLTVMEDFIASSSTINESKALLISHGSGSACVQSFLAH